MLELSGLPLEVGSVNRVTVFGCLPLVDQGEIDWKVLAIRSDHPLAVFSSNQNHITSIKDYANLFPEKFEYLSTWFLRYKVLEGKATKNYYFGDYMNFSRNQVVETIMDMHHHWTAELKEKGFAFPPPSN